MKLLLTGFDPFGGETINPSFEAVRQIPDHIGTIEIVKQELPTVFGTSVALIREYILKEKPDAVLCVGQAGGRAALSFERVAINCMDASIADNTGSQPVDQEIVIGGKTAYFTTLPIKKMAAAVKAEQLPAEISNTAGTFVCNQLMYGTLCAIEEWGLHTKAGFVHIPYIPQQAAKKPTAYPSMTLPDIVKGLTAAIRVLEQMDTGEKEDDCLL